MILFNFFKHDKLYIKVSKNFVEIIDVDKNRSINGKSLKPFSSERLLIAEFKIAEDFMNELVSKLKKGNNVKRNKIILFHPMDFVDGGISEVESRVFLEIGERLNGKVVKIWTGDELTNEQVVSELKKNE